MTNKEAIKHLENMKWLKGYDNTTIGDEPLADIIDKMIELLKEQPKWIPINERKPNSCGVYIVARWFIDGCRMEILTDACYFDGSNTWHDDTRVNHSRPYLTDKIVAWMPLPEAPKAGEQE